jgi:hypothetical protein
MIRKTTQNPQIQIAFKIKAKTYKLSRIHNLRVEIILGIKRMRKIQE